MLSLDALFFNVVDCSTIELCLARLIDSGDLYWDYVDGSASTIHDDKVIPDNYNPSVFIRRSICQHANDRREFLEEDLQTPLTEEVWKEIEEKIGFKIKR